MRLHSKFEAGVVTTSFIDENPDLLPAVRLGLGALGILVDVTLACVPAFLLRPVPKKAMGG